MCSRPQTMFSKAAGREVTFACRKCDQCVATRRHGWVARAMAEKAMHPQTFVVALTYSEGTQFTRDGARFFRYKDVRLFLARLRDAIKQATGKVAALRFIAAGEQGSRKGRCHWHVVLYSDVDLLSIGEFGAPWGVVTEREHIVAKVGVDMPRSWSMWPHGFVQVQEPDEGGMHYALSYALKDQFSIANSRGTMREGRVEEFSTGVFRPSKSPPIGASFIDETIYRMYQGGYVIPKLMLQVPNMRGEWYVSGVLRKRLLQGIRRVNNSLVAQYGRNAGQWSSLVHQVKDSEGDLEALGLNMEPEDEEETIETKIARTARQAAADQQTRNIVRQCGGHFPCNLCARGLSDEALAGYGLAIDEAGNPIGQTPEIQAALDVDRSSKRRSKGISRGCQLRETISRKRAFPQSAG